MRVRKPLKNVDEAIQQPTGTGITAASHGQTIQHRGHMEQEQEQKVSGKRMRLLVAGVLLLLLVCGAAWYLLRPAAELSQEEIDLARAEGPVQYLDLEPSFLVNFPHQGRQRYLQASISVMSRDDEAMQAVQHHMPAIRHRLNNVLSAQVLLVFEDPTGIEALRQLAADEVRQVLLQEIGREGVDELLFTSFVMQ